MLIFYLIMEFVHVAQPIEHFKTTIAIILYILEGLQNAIENLSRLYITFIVSLNDISIK